jgi:hypothetical protein
MADLTTTNTSEKPQFEGTHIDDVKIDSYDSYGLVKSRYDELSIPRTLWVFKRVVLVSLAVYTGYVCEGFEVSTASPPAYKAMTCCGDGRGLMFMRYSSALEVA